jgi:hypothetical protein
VADYSAMKPYMKKNNLHYFTFFQNSEKTIKASPRQGVKDIYINSLENLGFNDISAEQTTVTRTALKRQINTCGTSPSNPFYLT